MAGLALISAGLSGHEWPAPMVDHVRTNVRSVVPDGRLRAYGEHRGVPVLDDDVHAMALAHARFLVAGPQRDPAAVDGRVWSTALAMLRDVFRREWSGPSRREECPTPAAVDRLATVRTPTLVINGLADAPWIQQVSDRLAAGISQAAQRLDLPDTGHVAPLERPRETTVALRRFLAARSPDR